jgi:hypothetical protein
MSDIEDNEDVDSDAGDDLEELEDIDSDSDDDSLDIDDGDDLDDDLDDDDEDSAALRAVEKELSQKDQNARALAIRREIERRAEQKRLAEDLDYLDLDLED